MGCRVSNRVTAFIFGMIPEMLVSCAKAQAGIHHVPYVAGRSLGETIFRFGGSAGARPITSMKSGLLYAPDIRPIL
jgi:hypothetical protein